MPYLKVYQIHSATLETGVLENKEVLEQLAFLKNNYDLQIGLTTTGTNQTEVIKKALDVVVDEKQLFDSFQVTYNFLEQSLQDISDELIHQNKEIIIKEALANGRIIRNSNYPNYKSMSSILEKLALKYSIGVDAIALKYCGQTISKSTILSGASNSKQLKENLKVNSFSLSNEDLNILHSLKIDSEFYWNERKKLVWN